MRLLLVLFLASYVAADEKCFLRTQFYVFGPQASANHFFYKNGGWTRDNMVIGEYRARVWICHLYWDRRQRFSMLSAPKHEGVTTVNVSGEEINGRLYMRLPASSCNDRTFKRHVDNKEWFKYESYDKAAQIAQHPDRSFQYTVRFEPKNAVGK